MLHWIKNFFNRKKQQQSAFEKAFSQLRSMGQYDNDSAKRTYELLSQLDSTSTAAFTDELIGEFNKIHYASNTNTVFYFFLPIVSHILFYKPNMATRILGHLIGPNFANGTSGVQEMIDIIQGAADLDLKENPDYLTVESQKWIKNTLPNLTKEIQNEIINCWKEINLSGNWIYNSWQKDQEEDHLIHPEDLAILRNGDQGIGLAFCEEDSGDYIKIKTRTYRVRVKKGGLGRLHQAPVYLWNQPVKIKSKPSLSARIYDFFWHFKDGKYYFMLLIDNKLSKKRYAALELDLESE